MYYEATRNCAQPKNLTYWLRFGQFGQMLFSTWRLSPEDDPN
jgi:hypothetical protein